MKYLCLVYQEETKLESLSDVEYDAIVDENVEYHDELRRSRHYVASAPIRAVQPATTLRVWNGTMSITDGPLARTREQLGGFYIIDATDLNDAIRLASRMPSARLGSVEVRPLTEFNLSCPRTSTDVPTAEVNP